MRCIVRQSQMRVSVVCEQASVRQSEIERLAEFAIAAVSHFTRESFDRMHSRAGDANTMLTPNYNTVIAIEEQVMMRRLRHAQDNIARIDRMDINERNAQLRVAATESTFGRNHAKELNRLIEKHTDLFHDMLERAWRLHHDRTLREIRRDLDRDAEAERRSRD